MRLRCTAALLTRLPGPAFLALEAEAAAADGRNAVWRAEARPALPDDLAADAPANQLLPALLKPSEKRALEVVADWPWIAPRDLAALLGVSSSRLSRVLRRLDELGLVVRARLAGHRLALSDCALAGC